MIKSHPSMKGVHRVGKPRMRRMMKADENSIRVYNVKIEPMNSFVV